MPKQFDNTNRGMLFRVAKKKTDKHPDLNGKVNVDGVDRWLSGWWQKYTDNETGEERTGVSLSVGAPVQAAKHAGGSRDVEPEPRRTTTRQERDDDIPF